MIVGGHRDIGVCISREQATEQAILEELGGTGVGCVVVAPGETRAGLEGKRQRGSGATHAANTHMAKGRCSGVVV